MADQHTTASVPTQQQKRAMRDAIIMQCFGMLGFAAFFNNLVFLYLTKLDVTKTRIAFYLVVPMVGATLLPLPCGYLADRYGKKLIGFVGCVLQLIGFVFISIAGSVSSTIAEASVLGGIICFAVGLGVFSSSWFALLSPIVPENMRGRFFGRLRFTWQVVGMIFAAAAALVFTRETDIVLYQAMSGVLAMALLVRIFYFVRLPELEPTRQNESNGFRASLMVSLRTSGYASFCAYVFILMLFTQACCPMLFGFVAEGVLKFGENIMMWFGLLYMVGQVVGFYFGGKAVDRWGTKPVFLTCHCAFALVVLLFLLRGVWPALMAATVGVSFFAFGLVRATSSISITTEMFALIPSVNKAVATSLFASLQHLGIALAGGLVALALNLGVLSGTWSLFGMRLSQYDALLFAFAIMGVLMVVTLGLVPSVLRKAE